MNQKQVTVRVPATTANLGPGFDTLGIALSLYNRITVRLGVTRPSPGNKMMREAACAFFAAAKRRIVPVDVSIHGEIPISRGLGSSVTVRLGIVMGLNELHGRPLSQRRLLEVVTGLEGHPDNAAPALLGGFVASATIDDEIRTFRAEIPSRVKFVAVIPDIEIETTKARKVLPARVTLHDAVTNVNRVALITAAFVGGDYWALRGVFEDTLHQPYRRKLLPPLFEVIRAGERAGALGGWLSGSGSTIICVTLDHAQRVASAMRRELARRKISAHAHVWVATARGAMVEGPGKVRKP